MLGYYLLIVLSIATAFCSACGRKSAGAEKTISTEKKLFPTEPFRSVRAFVSPVALSDWGKLNSSPPEFPFIEPSDAQGIVQIVTWAKVSRVKLRVRGRGHSMDGKSLPQANELLVLTGNLRSMRKVSDGLIEVGAGVSLYAINQWLRKFGKSLPVHNDGLVGPSVGGFISAGGIGRGSRHHGGFWNNVTQITLVDGTGNVRILDESQPAFPWLFGSMGQLGIITSARLKIVPLEGQEQKTLPAEDTIGETWQTEPGMVKQTEDSYNNEYLYWFSIFAPASEEKKLRSELNAIKQREPDLLKFMPEYFWPMKYSKFTPPLLFSSKADFVCIGIWGHIDSAIDRNEKNRRVLRLENEITVLLRRHPGYRRYIQSEVIPSPSRLKSYFSPAVLAHLKALKSDFDPQGILNPIEGLF